MKSILDYETVALIDDDLRKDTVLLAKDEQFIHQSIVGFGQRSHHDKQNVHVGNVRPRQQVFARRNVENVPNALLLFEGDLVADVQFFVAAF